MFALTVLFAVSMINSWNSRLIASYNYSYTVVHMKQKHSFTGTYGLGTGPILKASISLWWPRNWLPAIVNSCMEPIDYLIRVCSKPVLPCFPIFSSLNFEQFKIERAYFRKLMQKVCNSDTAYITQLIQVYSKIQKGAIVVTSMCR